MTPHDWTKVAMWVGGCLWLLVMLFGWALARSADLADRALEETHEAE